MALHQSGPSVPDIHTKHDKAPGAANDVGCSTPPTKCPQKIFLERAFVFAGALDLVIRLQVSLRDLAEPVPLRESEFAEYSFRFIPSAAFFLSDRICLFSRDEFPAFASTLHHLFVLRVG